MEEEYARGMGLVLDGELILPRHSEEAFKNFCTWFALDAERSRSLESTVRTAGSFLTKLQLPDVTKHGSVKAHVRDLISEIGIAHEPATTATPRMLKLMVEEVVRGRFNIGGRGGYFPPLIRHSLGYGTHERGSRRLSPHPITPYQADTMGHGGAPPSLRPRPAGRGRRPAKATHKGRY